MQSRKPIAVVCRGLFGGRDVVYILPPGPRPRTPREVLEHASNRVDASLFRPDNYEVLLSSDLDEDIDTDEYRALIIARFKNAFRTIPFEFYNYALSQMSPEDAWRVFREKHREHYRDRYTEVVALWASAGRKISDDDIRVFNLLRNALEVLPFEVYTETLAATEDHNKAWQAFREACQNHIDTILSQIAQETPEGR